MSSVLKFTLAFALASFAAFSIVGGLGAASATPVSTCGLGLHVGNTGIVAVNSPATVYAQVSMYGPSSCHLTVISYVWHGLPQMVAPLVTHTGDVFPTSTAPGAFPIYVQVTTNIGVIAGTTLLTVA